MYIRVGIGGGGASGYTIYITTEDSNLYGYTITISKNGTTVGTTSFDNQGEAEYTVEETGTYTVSVTYDGVTYSKEVVVSAFEVSLATGFVLDEWLTAGDVSGTYADLSEVLVDEEAVRKLMSVHDAVDYLASFTDEDTSVIAILNNDLCAKWITSRDYAEDTLTAAYGTLMASIGKYGYGEWSLQGQVPKMTSATAPIGTVIGGVVQSTGADPWKAFDGNDTTSFMNSSAAGNNYVGYHFVSPVVITCVRRMFIPASTYKNHSFDIQASNNGADWTTLKSVTNDPTPDLYVSFENTTAYEYYRIANMISDGAGQASPFTNINNIYTLQFYTYAPKNAVPIMTSATAPYGEAFASSAYSGQVAYMMFDGSYTSYWTSSGATVPAYVGYAFPNPVAVKRFELIARADDSSKASIANTCKFQGSNTGANDDWHDVTDSFTYYPWDITKSPMAVNVATPVYYLRYRLLVTVTGEGYVRGGSELRMYGRALKVSVPKMTSNTAPYGETNKYQVFDGDSSTTAGSDANFYYKFIHPVCIKMASILTSSNVTSTLQYSDDGETWTSLGEEQSVTANVQKIFSVQNTGYHLYYRISNSSAVTVKDIQFYGDENNLEYDWDANYPRHYIYDRGLELETLTLSGTATKEVEDIRLSAANAQASVSIDTTDYTLLRGVVYDRASGTNALLCGSGSANFVAGNMPYLQGLDVSSLNGSNATGVKQTGAGDFTVESLWLE